ncbi:MAG: TIGR03667 family PPOX class F420-dependent oxidoreductase [Anaerolineaceae bacterium]|nr:TIGR03667 family PPOX class F420-dependent oxidoreductase [Anaerolineaceae bacterium]
MVDFTSEFGKHVVDRLEHEKVIWLTTVSSDGTPQPNPVWFYWSGENFLIYTTPNASKLKNITFNPKISLNFEGASPLGGDVVVFTGEATIEKNRSKPDPGYEKKYLRIATEEWNRTIEDLFEEYSVAIRIKPKKLRGFN